MYYYVTQKLLIPLICTSWGFVWARVSVFFHDCHGNKLPHSLCCVDIRFCGIVTVNYGSIGHLHATHSWGEIMWFYWIINHFLLVQMSRNNYCYPGMKSNDTLMIWITVHNYRSEITISFIWSRMAPVKKKQGRCINSELIVTVMFLLHQSEIVPSVWLVCIILFSHIKCI